MKNEEIRKIIGQRIKHYRTIHCLTQKQLASELGTERPYISNIEQGQKAISFEKIYELCKFFNITVSDLLPIETKNEIGEKEYVIKNIANALRTWEIEQVKLLETMIPGKR